MPSLDDTLVLADRLMDALGRDLLGEPLQARGWSVGLDRARRRLGACHTGKKRITVSAHLMRKETFIEFWRGHFGVEPESVTVEAYDPILSAACSLELLENRPRAEHPDIIVCENDALALGVIDTIRHRLKLRVPEDIAVIGFDDVPQCESPNYRLTTYRQPLTEMANYLVDVLESTEPGNLDRTFEGQLIVRESA